MFDYTHSLLGTRRGNGAAGNNVARLTRVGRVRVVDMEYGRLLDWLRETRALELGAARVMRDHAPRLANHPALSALLADNGKESQTQAIRLRACIGALDGGAEKATPIRRPPALAAVSQALAQVIDTEEASRGTLALYALKHLEIGSYRFLASEAENCREPDIAAICRHSLREEIEMAARLELELEAISDE